MSFKLQDRIQKIKGLPGKYKRTLLAMAAHARNDGTNMWAGKPTLAAEMGVVRFTVNRNVEIMLVCGLIKEAQSHQCPNDFCPKGTRHYTQRGNHWTQVYDIDLVALQNVTPLRKKVASQNVQESRHILSESDVTFCAANLGEGNPVPLGSDESSALTSGESKKESSLASLARQGADAPLPENQKQDSLGVSPKQQEQTQPQQRFVTISRRVVELESTWTNRTGYAFSDEDKLAADALIRSYGYGVVQAVLYNTLYQRPKSRKMRWNKFQTFADNWELNYEAYRSYCTDNPVNKVVDRFDSIIPYTVGNKERINEYTAFFKENNKQGDWTLDPEEVKGLGYTGEARWAAICLVVEDGLVVTKDEFIAIMHHAAGNAPLAKAASAADEV